jgi:hypothetical protein
MSREGAKRNGINGIDRRVIFGKGLLVSGQKNCLREYLWGRIQSAPVR